MFSFEPTNGPEKPHPLCGCVISNRRVQWADALELPDWNSGVVHCLVYRRSHRGSEDKIRRESFGDRQPTATVTAESPQ